MKKKLIHNLGLDATNRIWWRTLLGMLVLTVGLGIWHYVRAAGLAAGPVREQADVGGVALPGQALFDEGSGTVAVSGAGNDIWNGSDAFRFAYGRLSGDGQITARVVGFKSTNASAKAGVMLRENLDSGSRHCIMLVRPNKETAFQGRQETGSWSFHEDGLRMTLPAWVKVERQGWTVRAFQSLDGVNWRLVGWNTINLPQELLAGLAVCSHETNILSEAVFEHVSVGSVDWKPVAGDGDGMAGHYYESGSGKLVESRVDSTINFGWGMQLPVAGLSTNRFEARWECEVVPAYSEIYQFHAIHDDGIRLWLNNRLLIDDWHSHPPKSSVSAPVSLQAGQRYTLRIEYFNGAEGATMKLAWSSPSTPVQIIPKEAMHSKIVDSDGDGLPDAWETANGLNPNDPADATRDADGDGLSNLEEYLQGADPRRSDTDGDGMSDAWEVTYGLNPYLAADAEQDLDGDGLSNLAESKLGTDPRLVDTDGDGFSDGREAIESGTNPVMNDVGGTMNMDFVGGLKGADIGRMGPAGSMTFDPVGGRLAIKGSGGDIWGRADGFYYAYRPLYGDGEVIVRVAEIDPTSDWAKAGIMVRENLSADARHACIGISAQRGIFFYRRGTSDTRTISDSLPRALAGWLKIVRRGDIIEGWYSVNGRDWYRLGWDVIALPSQVYIGLAVCSRESKALCQAQFEQLKMTALRSEETLPGEGNGLLGKYLNRTNGAVEMRVDAMVNFDWNEGAPISGFSVDDFEASWTGEVEAPATDAYTFHVQGDDGVRLWIDNRLVLDGWRNQPVTSYDSQPVFMKAGRRHVLRLDYFEHKEGAIIKLAWSATNQPMQIVPVSRLYSSIKDSDGDGMPDDWEIENGLNPNSPSDAAQDADKDGLSNLQEFTLGLDPQKTDTDGDGLEDGWEVAHGLNALQAADALEDSDRDGLSNIMEHQLGTDPLKPDSDGNGFSDAVESIDLGEHPQLENNGAGIAINFRKGMRSAAVGKAPRGQMQDNATQDSITVAGGGVDTWNYADEFQYVYRSLYGDGEMTVRVAAIQPTSDWAKAGIMVREDLTPGSRHAFLAMTPGNGTVFERRTTPGGHSVGEDNFRWTVPGWLKLIRRGGILEGWYSPNGINWQRLGWESLELPSQVYIGLAVCSHTNNALCQARFEQPRLTALRSAEPLDGNGDGLLATYFNSLNSQLVAARVDAGVNFDWELGSPGPGISSDDFCVRWEGEVEPTISEDFTFHVISDDGVRLWVDNRRVIDAWHNHPSKAFQSEAVALKAGKRHVLRLEYYEHKVHAGVKLAWRSASIPLQIVPAKRCFSRVQDGDADGMPNVWEIEQGLDPQDAQDAAQDLDNDGLTNLQEYQAGTDPRKADTDGDGMPDGWEVKQGLCAYDARDAVWDKDRDGLANLAEFRAGTDPQNADTDGDGLPDGMEVNGSGTSPLKPDIKAAVNVIEIPGSRFVTCVGQWNTKDQSVFAESRRGYVEYQLETTKADVYRIEIEGGERSGKEPVRPLPILVSVDGESVARLEMTYAKGADSKAYCFTPWLPAGVHRIRLFFDNYVSGYYLRIKAVRLQSLESEDANGNGVKDWVEQLLLSRNTLDATHPSGLAGVDNGILKETTDLVSAVSPVCLEGQGAFYNLMNLAMGTQTADGAKLATANQLLKHGAGVRWYADVPLTADAGTSVALSFENGMVQANRMVFWRPLNLLAASNLVVRAGDQVMFGVGADALRDSTAKIQVEVVGVTNYQGVAGATFVHQFEKAGTYRVTGVLEQGQRVSRTINVKVLAGQFNGDPACWLDRPYYWNCPDLPIEAAVEFDPRINWRETVLEPEETGRQFEVTVDAAAPRYAIARVATNGAVLASAKLDGFNMYSAGEVGQQIIEVLPDGSQIIEMTTILTAIPPGLRLRFCIYVGGVVFDDGTVVKELTAADFNELGEAKVRFVRPAGSQTSVCHRTEVYQGTTLIDRY